MSKDEALKLALEALEFDGFTPEDATHRHYTTKAITAIRKALAEQPAQQHGCSRSHPHENMNAMCELRTEIARLTNENARLKLQIGVS